MIGRLASSNRRVVEPTGTAAVHWHFASCIAQRRGASACDACVQACPNGSLNLVDDAVAVNDGCIGCGRCAAACPTGALDVRGFSIPAPGTRSPASAVECARVPAGLAGDALRVPCLRGVGTAQWLGMVEQSRSLHIVDRGWCVGCPANAGCDSHPLDDALAGIDTLLADLDWPTAARPRRLSMPTPLSQALPLAEGTPESPSRRALFARVRRIIAAEVPDTPPSSRQLRSLPMPLPARDSLRVVVRRMADCQDRPIPAGLFATLTVAESCSNENACVAACPTGALRIEPATDAAVELRFSTARCIACGACERACPHEALQVSLPAVDLAQAEDTTLRLHGMRECSHCRSHFPSARDARLCPRCSQDQSMAADLFANKRAPAAHGTKLSPQETRT